MSWFLSSLKAPIPSESTTRHLKGLSDLESTKSIVLFQIQSPLVQGLMVGPTPKPLLSVYSSIILLSRNDLPVLYIPATAMTPTCSSFKLISNSRASSLTVKPIKCMFNQARSLLSVILTFFLIKYYEIERFSFCLTTLILLVRN